MNMTQNKDIGRKLKKIVLSLGRAGVYFGAGVFFELGTQFFANMMNNAIDKSSFKWLIIVVTVLVLFIAYFIKAHKARPIHSMDNDINPIFAAIFAVTASFSENFMAGLLSAMEPQSIALAILYIVIAAILLLIDFVILDKLVEKLQGDAQFIFQKQVDNRNRKLENESFTIDGKKKIHATSKDWEKLYVEGRRIRLIFAVAAVVLALAGSLLQCLYGLYWGC